MIKFGKVEKSMLNHIVLKVTGESSYIFKDNLYYNV